MIAEKSMRFVSQKEKILLLMTIVNIPDHAIINWNDLPPAIDVTIECIRSKLSYTMETRPTDVPVHPYTYNADEMGRKIDSAHCQFHTIA